MRRPRRALAAAIASCAGIAATLGSVGGASADEPPAPRLMVTAHEWDLTLSRATIRPGRAIVQLVNKGEDDHDLKIRLIPHRPVRTRVVATPVTRPGGISEVRPRLLRGRRYRLWCSLPGHKALGMRATLQVRR